MTKKLEYVIPFYNGEKPLVFAERAIKYFRSSNVMSSIPKAGEPDDDYVFKPVVPGYLARDAYGGRKSRHKSKLNKRRKTNRRRR